jgi:hypothetical protein
MRRWWMAATMHSRRAGWLISPPISSPPWSQPALHGHHPFLSSHCTTSMGRARKSPLMRPRLACVGSTSCWRSSQLGTRPERKIAPSTGDGSPTCLRFLLRLPSQVATPTSSRRMIASSWAQPTEVTHPGSAISSDNTIRTTSSHRRYRSRPDRPLPGVVGRITRENGRYKWHFLDEPVLIFGSETTNTAIWSKNGPSLSPSVV